jgi:hypothetical protein
MQVMTGHRDDRVCLSACFISRTAGRIVPKFGVSVSNIVFFSFLHPFNSSDMMNARTSKVGATLEPLRVRRQIAEERVAFVRIFGAAC